mmetsp:Transcript_150622/g.265820  ORF Transcript_150622/g.265820 Transcript_150622/m.265820 type:complete len:131 (-) Transcript_150622:64-456(-)
MRACRFTEGACAKVGLVEDQAGAQAVGVKLPCGSGTLLEPAALSELLLLATSLSRPTSDRAGRSRGKDAGGEGSMAGRAPICPDKDVVTLGVFCNDGTLDDEEKQGMAGWQPAAYASTSALEARFSSSEA